MTMSLISYRSTFLERVLDLLWRQWSSLGIAGSADDWRGGLIDPEALVLTTCSFGRYDARLFDAMLEWTAINGRYINIQRCKRIQANHALAEDAVFRAFAATAETSASSAKWAKIHKTPSTPRISPSSSPSPQPMFILKDGHPMPVVGSADPTFAQFGLLRDRYEPRGVAQSFRPDLPANLLLRLRAMFGVNARCEIIAYLLVNRSGSPREISRRTHYYPATIANALAEMRDSGFVISRSVGRRRVHRLVSQTWNPLLLGTADPRWLVWPPIFEALEAIWRHLCNEKLDQESTMSQASALRRVLLGSVVERLEENVPELVFGDLKAYPGEELTPIFLDKIAALFKVLTRAS